MSAPNDDHIGLRGHGFQNLRLFRDTDIGLTFGGVIIGRQRDTALRFIGQIPAVFTCQDIRPTGSGSQSLPRRDAVAKTQYGKAVQRQSIGIFFATSGAGAIFVAMPGCLHIIVYIAVTAGAGVGCVAFFGAGGRGGNRGVLMLPVKEINLILVAVAPHGNIDSNRALGGDEIAAVFGKFRMAFRGGHCFCNAVCAEEGNPDSVCGSIPVFTGFSPRSRKNLFSRFNRNCYGMDIFIFFPIDSARKIILVVFKNIPEVKSGADIFRKVGIMRCKIIFLPYAFNFPCFGFTAAGAGSLFGHRFALSGDFLYLPTRPAMNVTVFSADSTDTVRCIMEPVQNIEFIAVIICPHRDIGCGCAFRHNKITAISYKFLICSGRIGCFSYAIFAEKCHTDTIGGVVSVLPGFSKSSGKNPLTGIYRNGNRANIFCSVGGPMGAAIIELRIMLQQRPQIQSAANVCR